MFEDHYDNDQNVNCDSFCDLCLADILLLWIEIMLGNPYRESRQHQLIIEVPLLQVVLPHSDYNVHCWLW